MIIRLNTLYHDTVSNEEKEKYDQLWKKFEAKLDREEVTLDDWDDYYRLAVSGHTDEGINYKELLIKYMMAHIRNEGGPMDIPDHAGIAMREYGISGREAMILGDLEEQACDLINKENKE